MKGYKANDGFNAMQEDILFMEASLAEGITNRSSDLFGIGGFISGGVVSINGSDHSKVDITAGVGYDSNGERFSFISQTGLTVPDLAGGNNWVLVSYDNFDDTPVSDPVYGQVQNTRTQEQTLITIKATFTQGDLDPSGNPYTPIALVVKPGADLQISDKRLMLLDLKINTVDNPQIVDEAVTASKLAKYLRQAAWTDDPGLYYDSYSGQLKMTGVFSSNPAFYMPGNPATNALDMTVFPLTCTKPSYIIATETTFGSRVWTVSAVAVTSTSFATDGILKDQLFLGYVNNNGIFENVQTVVASEIVLASEDETQTGTPRTPLHKNLWRRTNEAFRSYTPLMVDGVAITNPHQVTFNAGAGSFQVAPGVSYVAGRRFRTTSIITITSVNTTNYPSTVGAGTFGLWILREPVGGKQFSMTNAVLPNAYLIALLSFDTGSNPIGVSGDERVFTPFAELDEILLTNEAVLTGAGLKYYDGTHVSVDAGVIGFPDGQVRKNTSSKLINLAAGPVSYLIPLTTGVKDTTVNMEPYTCYAVFAVADHIGPDFNVIASKMPLVGGMTNVGSAQDQYSVLSSADLVNLKAGQRVRLTDADRRLNQTTTNAYFPDGERSQHTSNDDCYISNIVGNVIHVAHADGTTGAGPSNTSYPGQGMLQVLENLVVGSSMSPPLVNYRFLGVVVTDSSAHILPFKQSGGNIIYEQSQGFFSIVSNTGNFNLFNPASRVHDISHLCPGVAGSVCLKADVFMYGGGAENTSSPGPASTTVVAVGNEWSFAIDVRSGLGSSSYHMLGMKLLASTGFKDRANDTSHENIGLHGGMITTYLTGTNVWGGYSLAWPSSWSGSTPLFDFCLVSGTLFVDGFFIDIKKEWRLQ